MTMKRSTAATALAMVLAAQRWAAAAGTPRDTELVEALLRLQPLAPAANALEARPQPDREAPAPRSYSNASSRKALEKDAAAAHDDEGYVLGGASLTDLTRIDWLRAQPLLARFAEEREPRRAALALALLYRHELTKGAQVEALRLRLKSIATDRRAPGAARTAAFEALLTTDWAGRDDWYIAQFADPTLRDMADHDVVSNPLAKPVASAPDRWIPRIVKLLGHRDRAVHDMAVTCLVQFHGEDARADALRPLLPWLRAPSWSSARDRLRLIQSVARLELKEAVPGLIAVLGQRTSQAHDEFERSYAAESLAHFGDRRAMPALRRAIALEPDGDHQRRIYGALLACGAVGATEAAAALEELARRGGRDKAGEAVVMSSEKLPPASPVVLGLVLVQRPPPGDDVIERLVRRAHALERSQPLTSEELRRIVDAWDTPAANRDLMRRLELGPLSAAAVRLALAKRASLRASASETLRRLATGADDRAGVAAALLDDAGILAKALDTPGARGSVLACARIARQSLPLDRVAPMLKEPGPGVAAAAQAYLRANDGAEARLLLQAAAGRTATILGNRSAHDPGHVSFGAFDRIEDELRQAVLDGDGPDQILALLTGGYWGGAGDILVRIKGGRASLSFTPDPARSWDRPLAPAELAALRASLTEQGAESLGPLETNVADGLQVEFVHITRAGGRRVFMNNPGMAKDSPHNKVCEAFSALLRRPGLVLHYALAKRRSGLEILAADPHWAVSAVRKVGTELMVALSGVEQSARSERNPPATSLLKVPFPPPGRGRRTWAAWPSLVPVSRERQLAAAIAEDELPKGFRISDWLNRHRWASRRGGVRYLVGEADGSAGLWRLSPDGALAKITGGTLAMPILSADGRWIVAARADRGWAAPNHLVRIDTMTGRVSRIDIPAADNLAPVIPTVDGVLVMRARDDPAALPEGTEITGPVTPEYFLVDPTTGHTRRIDGEFDPIPHDSAAPFQSAGGDKIWAVRPKAGTNTSILGRYDLRRFVFTPVMELPDLPVRTGDVWVDEAVGKVYAAYRGDLLRLPLEPGAGSGR
jgi:hypothetical protein